MIDFSQYKVRELKEELKKRGLNRTGKKADLVARLTKAVNDEAFPLFPKLPPELRVRYGLTFCQAVASSTSG